MRSMAKRIPPLGQVPLTPAVFHILLALADGPLHGYAVMQAVERTAGAGLRMGPGTIYGSLQRMEEAGLVRELPPRTDDRRRLFAMLPAGRRALAAEAKRLTRLAELVHARRLAGGEA
jgi:DNA-binding PadR family transcriptional regulator